ncbi:MULTISPECIES: DUF3180 domain-containing protein [unclassified Curtobacterium]|uniref:DUF3180 domain-containing protein n=1 Tax=unclassified Curtobacterium TaxID=257496 RepID=UPI00089DF0ED|nr:MULTISPECIES: DUF3180 domain-containing protein [unclassified Curtobacterium]AOX65572.1 hypothetical protein BJK06_07220 [Curtobacterium sp. BH-2-1-1]MCC8907959.1 DUF3180 domain-containing protein [Curtobacterium sp. GD1]MCT9620548.1 DUF3180 domain-containing protein [Curtobacterium sp. C2H10]MDR6169873.1 lysylphosphatidylglycerol synthetase-like protein (DUF2156 family) [Curtobacterium sp. SORGH_AS_0776]MDR6575106.1 lysylphosphatidylglycerol synthetase-like protein (DUF2156 family) [Curtob
MKPTRASTLLSVAVVAAVAGFALDAVLASRQAPTLFLATPLGVTLAFIGIAVVLMARPVRRHARDGASRSHPVDPLYAIRVVVLAKASSIAGSLFGGFGAGLLVYLLTRSAFPSLGSVLPNAVAVGGGLVLTVCALVAERMCIAPPGDDDDDDLPRGGTTQAH